MARGFSMVHSRIERTNEPTIPGRLADDFVLNLAGKLNFLAAQFVGSETFRAGASGIVERGGPFAIMGLGGINRCDDVNSCGQWECGGAQTIAWPRAGCCL